VQAVLADRGDSIEACHVHLKALSQNEEKKAHAGIHAKRRIQKT
jgi:hypothetical protein